MLSRINIDRMSSTMLGLMLMIVSVGAAISVDMVSNRVDASPRIPAPIDSTDLSPALGELFKDNFDTYAAGTFPSTWNLNYAGAGSNYQYVDTTHFASSPQSLHLVAGSGCWGALAYHSVDFPVDGDRTVTLTAKVYVDKIAAAGCDDGIAGVRFLNPGVGTWGTAYGLVLFRGDGFIHAETSGQNLKLMTYTAQRWYTVQSKLNLTAKTYDVYIDGVFKAGGLRIPELDTSAPTGFDLGTGHSSFATAWFDDISVIRGETLAFLISPAGSINSQTPTFQWSAVPGVTWYFLWVDDSTGNRIKTWYSAADVGCASGTGTCSISPSVALAQGACQWWIQTWNSTGYGPWSVPLSFTVTGSTPGKATLISPSGTISGTNPTYTWNPIAAATWYQLWVNDSSGSPKLRSWYTATQAGCASGTGTCSVTPTTPLATGQCQWWIQTWNESGYGPWSDGMAFTVSGAGTPGKAILVFPSGSTATTSPTYLWYAVPDATWYQLWVDDSSGSGKIRAWFTSAQAGCASGTGNCSITVSTPLSPGACRWWIQTWNDYGYGPWSDSMQFTVTANTACVPLPVPVLTYTGKSDYIGSDGNEYTMYRLNVENKNSFQDDLFVPAPELPPCGLNTNASRTWVLIYFSDGSYIYGFCGLKSSAELGSLWFGYPRGQTLPYSVYIVINDRKCSLSAASNRVRID